MFRGYENISKPIKIYANFKGLTKIDETLLVKCSIAQIIQSCEGLNPYSNGSEAATYDQLSQDKYNNYTSEIQLIIKKMKKILYIDMDGVLVDFQTGIEACEECVKKEFEGNMDEVPGIFGKMKPMKGAVEAFKILSQKYDTYILSTAPWNNPSAWCDKVEWVKKHLGDNAYKRLILTHNKNLNKGDYLIDDRNDKNGADRFEGELIWFGKEAEYPSWKEVLEYLQ